MQIQSSSVTMTNQHLLDRKEQQYRRVTERETHLVNEPQRSNTPNVPSPATLIQLSIIQTASSLTHQTTTEPKQAIENIEQEISLLKLLVEAMIGKKIENKIVNASVQSDTDNSDTPATKSAPAAPENTINTISDNRNIETTVVTLSDIQEYEYSLVSINANLNTADGLMIDISMNIEMERRFQQTRLDVSVQQGRLTDPLVINFNGDTVKLSDERVAFDLDSDGSTELIPSLISNSAYIALDRNGDGIITLGSELFGPNSGDGFAELAVFDEDNNGFIDSNDSVYSQLVAFNPGENETRSLQSLNINALYLTAQNSPFRLTDNANNTLGTIRSTSFYIDDRYQPGSIQQIDLSV